MKVTVLGGGNIGTALAVMCSANGAEVSVLTSRPEEFVKDPVILCKIGNEANLGKGMVASSQETSDGKDVSTGSQEFMRRKEAASFNDTEEYMRGRDVTSTDDPEEALKGADLIFFTYPAYLAEEWAMRLTDLLPESSVLCFVPGNGGMELVFRVALSRGVVLCGMERAPTIARIKDYGRSVVCGNLREELHVAAIPERESGRAAEVIEKALNIRTKTIKCYLNLSLTPSNPVLHTSRLRVIFKDYKPGKIYDELPLFYEDWDQESAELLLECDEEVQRVVKGLKELSLDGVKSLKEHYESEDAEALVKKLSSIPAFKGIKTPAVRKGEGFTPDFSSRYFVSDFPYGLKLILDTAGLAGVETPKMSEIYRWYKDLVPGKKEFSFRSYGIGDKKELIGFYGNDAVIY